MLGNHLEFTIPMTVRLASARSVWKVPSDETSQLYVPSASTVTPRKITLPGSDASACIHQKRKTTHIRNLFMCIKGKQNNPITMSIQNVSYSAIDSSQSSN